MLKRCLSIFHTCWISGLFLIGICSFLILYFFNSFWTVSIDIALHYALVARLSEHWNLPTNDDPSLGEMNVVPRYAHRIAAIFGNFLKSPLAGMQFVAMLSLASLWSGFAFIFLSLPRRKLWLAFGALAALLLINRLFIHLELFGNELLGNYFYPQLVGQAAAIILIAVVLWMERTGISPIPGYLILAGSVPIIQQFHLLPALEVLAVLTLLVAANILNSMNEHRWIVFVVGLFAFLVSLLVTVNSSAFATIVAISETHGLLKLNYTPNVSTLAIESAIVILLSAFLVVQWMRLDQNVERMDGLALKYIGLFGVAVGGLCLLQIILLKLGYGSEYACKKYAFGLNTTLMLEAPLLLVSFLNPHLLTSRQVSSELHANAFQHVFAGFFVFVAFFTILPSPSAKVVAVTDVIFVERIIKIYSASNFTDNSSKYNYGIGLFPNYRVYDYLITIGVFKTPRANDAEDLLFGYPLSKPRMIGRIFTREGSIPWDVPECRQYLTNGGFAILDGPCVLDKLKSAEP
jgi:hypothetical protein